MNSTERASCICPQLALHTLTSALLLQADFRELFLKLLEQCGLRRSKGGSALVLTGSNSEEHADLDDIATKPVAELCRLYTVRSHFQPQSQSPVNKVESGRPLCASMSRRLCCAVLCCAVRGCRAAQTACQQVVPVTSGKKSSNLCKQPQQLLCLATLTDVQ